MDSGLGLEFSCVRVLSLAVGEHPKLENGFLIARAITRTFLKVSRVDGCFTLDYRVRTLACRGRTRAYRGRTGVCRGRTRTCRGSTRAWGGRTVVFEGRLRFSLCRTGK